jgi:hypothetical protein
MEVIRIAWCLCNMIKIAYNLHTKYPPFQRVFLAELVPPKTSKAIPQVGIGNGTIGVDGSQEPAAMSYHLVKT